MGATNGGGRVKKYLHSDTEELPGLEELHTKLINGGRLQSEGGPNTMKGGLRNRGADSTEPRLHVCFQEEAVVGSL